jgi:hypothetical protein
VTTKFVWSRFWNKNCKKKRQVCWIEEIFIQVQLHAFGHAAFSGRSGFCQRAPVAREGEGVSRCPLQRRAQQMAPRAEIQIAAARHFFQPENWPSALWARAVKGSTKYAGRKTTVARKARDEKSW